MQPNKELLFDSYNKKIFLFTNLLLYGILIKGDFMKGYGIKKFESNTKYRHYTSISTTIIIRKVLKDTDETTTVVVYYEVNNGYQSHYFGPETVSISKKDFKNWKKV